MCEYCPVEKKQPKSAKAKSVVDLANSPYSVYNYAVPKGVLVWPTIDDSHKVEAYIRKCRVNGTRIFARPAPLTPVHGFIDSREIQSYGDFTSIAWEIVEKKPEGEILEIIVMPMVEAKYSGIVTPKAITIGRDNDGATGGKKSIVIRTPTSLIPHTVDSSLAAKFTKPGESTFIEIVTPEKGTSTIVQIRSGNEAGDSNDFVPYNVTVKRVFEVTEETDLVEWQKTAKTLVEGDVIYAASLSCHGAVHGVAHQIPVITSHRPEIGEELKAGNKPKIDLNRVKDLLTKLINTDEKFENYKVLYGWKLTHTIAANLQAGGEESVAYALYYMMMGGVSACLGEYRHIKDGPCKKFEKFNDEQPVGRHEIFKNAFTRKEPALRLLMNAWRGFLQKERWSIGSYGGPAWANCAEYTVTLEQKIARFVTNPTESNLNECVVAVNELAHCQHNGGLLFNKFGASEVQADDIFNRREVLETLLSLKEYEAPEGVCADKSIIRVMLRNVPYSISHYEEVKKRYEKKLAAKEAAAAKKAAEAKLQAKKQMAEKLLQAFADSKIQFRKIDSEIIRLQVKLPDTYKEFEIPAYNLPFLSKVDATKKSMAGSEAKYIPLVFESFRLNENILTVNCGAVTTKGNLPMEFKLNIVGGIN